MKFPFLLFLFILSAFLLKAQDSLYVSAKGEKLSAVYLSLDVEHLWLRGYPIDWETGKPRKENVYYEKGHSHCSAFVASACKRLGIYILRPPAHIAKLLANAQFDWLTTGYAIKDGWQMISDSSLFSEYYTAQLYANEGKVVVAVYKNPDYSKSGHIAMVLPYKLGINELNNQGPEIIQAGKENYHSAPLVIGFKNHLKNNNEKEIKFFYNTNQPAD